MKKLPLILILIFQIVAVSCFSACGNNDTPEDPKSEKLQVVKTYTADVLDKYLNPYWQTNEMYDEGGVVVGETGEIRLLRKPIKNSVTVRSVHFEETYREGIDYIVDGQIIRRIATGNMPYFKYEEYYFDEPYNNSNLLCNPVNAEIDYEGEKYLYYSEGSLGVKNYVMITYKTDDPYTQFIPEGDANAQSIINKIKNAPANGVVEVETRLFNSFGIGVRDALIARPDVTLKVSFLSEGYKGQLLKVTIPTGIDRKALFEESGWLGLCWYGSTHGYDQ